MTRREAIATAVALGASLAWPLGTGRRSSGAWRECRDCYPNGVAAGDPHPDGVILWTQRPPVEGSSASQLLVEIADDPSFRHVVLRAYPKVSAASDWTCRALVVGLAAGREYWYRFTDDHGDGSRAFVSWPQRYYARHIRDIVRYAHGEKHNDFHVPTTVEDYRALYQAYLLDPDLHARGHAEGVVPRSTPRRDHPVEVRVSQEGTLPLVT
jgi:phosphodiesterase/alkaline phosphatase D-like protein